MDIFQNWTPILGFILCFLIRFITCKTASDFMLLHEATTAPLTSYYDYIIVGGGTTGCPLAATLSENASVLLLERGGSPYENSNVTNMYAMWDTLLDVSPSSASEMLSSEDGVNIFRARVLGGGSSTSAGFYSRADDHFLRETGLESELLKESYEWVENRLVFKPTSTKLHSAVRRGLLEVGVRPNNGFTYDHLYGTKAGGVIYDNEGTRHTAADLLEYGNPLKITVLLHASVVKVLFTAKEKSTQSMASGVIFKDPLGTKHRALLNKGAKNEIILSAGAIGSPQLLMLSGVGSTKHLNSHNIEVVLDQPLVGQGMGDNPVNWIFVPTQIPIGITFPQVVGITKIGSYIGALGGNMMMNGKFVPQNDKDLGGGFIGEKVIGPLSRGHLELKSQNLDDDPLVTFNYFNDSKDLERCMNGMKIIEKLIESKSFSKIKYKNHSFSFLLNLTASILVDPKPDMNYTTALGQYCKDTVGSIGHYHGGCQLAKVVDQDYRIIGLDSIRVIDGSTFVSSPGVFPQATLMMLGRYMGIKILKERSGSIVQNIKTLQNDASFA